MPKLSLGIPQPKQELFLTDTHKHVAFGGARGGGKSWALDFKATVMCMGYAGIKINCPSVGFVPFFITINP